MKILFDSQIFGLQRYGGISRYYVELFSSLKSTDKIYIGIGIHQNRHLALLKIREGVCMFYMPRLVGICNRFVKILNIFGELINQMLIRPDLVHWTYYKSIHWKKLKVKSILTVYDMIHEIYPEQLVNPEAVTEKKRNATLHCDHIIAISHQTKMDLMNYFNVQESKISVIHLAVNSELIRKNIELPDETNQYISSPFILYVGERWTYKNFLRLLKAYAVVKQTHPEINLVCFGGDGFGDAEIQEMIDLKISNSVIQVSGDDVLLHQFYANCSLFVYPSIYEGFGLPPIEAIAAGAKVAASNQSCIPEVMGNICSYFNPNLIDEIAKVIMETLLRPPPPRNKVEEFLSYYSWQRCASEHREVYKKVLGV